METKWADEPEIIRRVVQGEVSAFEILVLRYQDRIFRIVRRRLPADQVEDTVQEVFVKAFSALSRLRNQDGFSHWISSIAVRTCYDYWRGEAARKERCLSAIGETHAQWLERSAADAAMEAQKRWHARKDAREILDWALSRLSPEDRVVLELVHLEGHSGKEAADLLGWSVTNVKVRAFRARKRLHRLLKELDV